jgi:hypothetical protein
MARSPDRAWRVHFPGPLLLCFLGPLQQRLHIGPQLAAGFLLGFGEFGERLRIAQAGEVGVGLPVLERLHRGGPVVRRVSCFRGPASLERLSQRQTGPENMAAGASIVPPIDRLQMPEKNGIMNTSKALIIPDEEADALAVIEHAMTGKPLNTDIVRRVRERSELATETLRRKYGTLNIAVDLIRETRDQE